MTEERKKSLHPISKILCKIYNTLYEKKEVYFELQDENINKGEKLYNDMPVELEEIIRKVELEMARQSAEPGVTSGSSGTAESSVPDELEIGN